MLSRHWPGVFELVVGDDHDRGQAVIGRRGRPGDDQVLVGVEFVGVGVAEPDDAEPAERGPRRGRCRCEGRRRARSTDHSSSMANPARWKSFSISRRVKNRRWVRSSRPADS